jgi:carbon-monoxide dehydrogenase large subunit
MGLESMRLRLTEDGIVALFTGQMPHGQSHQTTLAQIAADEFGVPFEQVRVVVGDTDVVPFGLTGGSRSATMTGGVALHGARQLKAKVLDFAANLMEVSAQDLLITDGNVWVRGDPASAISVTEVAQRAASGRPATAPPPSSRSRPRTTAAKAAGPAALTARSWTSMPRPAS